jgi:uncharacterized protein (UPF0147 family)
MPVLVNTADDWQKVSRIGGPVVDPMILRCGEIFLRGADVVPGQILPPQPYGAVSQSDVWQLLEVNLQGLSSFFDRIVLEDQIPVFDYTDSFKVDHNFDKTSLNQVNEGGEILVEVQVDHDVYRDVKSAAEVKLTELYTSSEYGITPGEAQNILGELATAGYIWYPFIPGIAFQNDDERQLAGYILAGLVFGGYAQLAGADHLMQPKRSRLFLATALKAYGPRSEEQQLFDALNQIPALKTAKIPFTPTFFPLLLHESRNPQEMIASALRHRHSPEVKEYREWLRTILDEFSKNGRIPMEVTREVQGILDAVRNRSESFRFPNIDFSVSVSGLTGAPEPEISIGLTEVAKSAWGWFLERLPGKRYRKLLTRAIILDNEYRDLTRRANTVWMGQG